MFRRHPLISIILLLATISFRWDSSIDYSNGHFHAESHTELGITGQESKKPHIKRGLKRKREAPSKATSRQ